MRSLLSRGSFTVPLGLALLVAGVVLRAATYEPDVRRMPFIVGSITLLLLGFELVRQAVDWRRASAGPGAGRQEGADKPVPVHVEGAAIQTESAAWSDVLKSGAGIILASAGVYLMGFVGASSLYVAGSFLAWGKVRWYWSLGLGLGTGAIVYFVIQGMLGFRLWTGAVPVVVPGVLGGGTPPPFL